MVRYSFSMFFRFIVGIILLYLFFFQERIVPNRTVYNPKEEMILDFKGYPDTGVAPVMIDNAALLLGNHGTLTSETVSNLLSIKFSKKKHAGNYDGNISIIPKL